MAELFGLGALHDRPRDRAADHRAGDRPVSTPGDRELIDAFARGITTSVDRVRLDREASRARVDAASQQSRAAFLSAMTHNLRTPLASIKATVSTLRTTARRLDATPATSCSRPPRARPNGSSGWSRRCST